LQGLLSLLHVRLQLLLLLISEVFKSLGKLLPILLPGLGNLSDLLVIDRDGGGRNGTEKCEQGNQFHL